MKQFKKFIPRLIALLVVCVLSVFGTVGKKIIKPTAAATMPLTVIIDAGHGGLTNTTD